eukprot:6206245-Pleurochrysis_carterae.AAC.2
MMCLRLGMHTPAQGWPRQRRNRRVVISTQPRGPCRNLIVRAAHTLFEIGDLERVRRCASFSAWMCQLASAASVRGQYGPVTTEFCDH